MLTVEQNDFYRQVAPGTPMGEAMRRFWWPILLSSELPEAESDPVRVKFLGDSFAAFRDTYRCSLIRSPRVRSQPGLSRTLPTSVIGKVRSMRPESGAIY
jgi:hypothetical protein